MTRESLTLRSIRARPVILALKRPVKARIATIADWPLILIDLVTEEGVVGRSYLEPYVPKAMLYHIPALHDQGEGGCEERQSARDVLVDFELALESLLEDALEVVVGFH